MKKIVVYNKFAEKVFLLLDESFFDENGLLNVKANLFLNKKGYVYIPFFKI